jgi:hypothetical protein
MAGISCSVTLVPKLIFVLLPKITTNVQQRYVAMKTEAE